MKNRILFCLLLSITNICLWAQPNAEFSVDINEGCFPLTVVFTDASQGNNLTYVWDFNDGNTSEQQNPTHTFIESGTYDVCLTIEDDNGEMSTNCLVPTVTVYPFSISDVVITEPSCNGESNGSICINEIQCGEAPYTYEWNSGDVTACPANLPTGSYTVTITDANNLTAVEFYTLDEPSPIQISNISIVDVSCNGGADAAIGITVEGGTAPYAFEWSNGMTSEDIVGVDAGSYDVTVTDANGCEFTSSNIFVNEPLGMELSASVVSATCGNADGSIDITVNGGTLPYLFNWNNGLLSVEDPTGLAAGFYTVVVTDANNCTTELVSDVSGLGGPIVELVNVTPVSCNGAFDGSIDIDVSGGTGPYTFLWSNGETGEDIQNLMAGTYFVTVNDALNCSTVLSAEVTEPSQILVNVQPTNADCNGTNGSLSVVASGGIAPYIYLWSNNDMTQVLSDLQPGEYTVTVTDAFGCTAAGSGIVESGSLNLDAIATEVTCGEMDGTIDLTVLDGVAPYSYIWNDATASTTEDLSGLDQGLYSVTVVDDNGCEGILDVPVTGGVPISISITGPAAVCEGEDILLCGPTSVGATYLWTGPNGYVNTTDCISFPNADVTVSGCYTLVITDVNGCTGEATLCVDVVSAADIIANISSDVSICAGESVQLSAELGGPVSDYTFEWTPTVTLDDPNSLEPIATPNVTTAYSLTVLNNASGCQVMESIIVNVIPDCVWPGDTDTNQVVNNFDLLNIGLAYDSVGPARAGANLMWQGQPAVDWMQTIPSGPNYKHIDCDGNGVINANDTIAITGNWGETHGFTGDSPDQFSNNDPTDGGDSQFFSDAPFYVQADTLIEGANMAFPIILGEEANAAEDIYGIAFSLTYDTTYIKESGVSVGFGPSWLGLNNDDMISIQRNYPEDGRIDIGMTRIDGMNITDFGQLAQLFITVEDDILFAPGDDPQFFTGGATDGGGEEEGFFTGTAIFDIINVKAVNAFGEEITIIPTETTVPVQTTTSTNNILPAGSIQIYPNPAKDRIQVNTKNMNLENIRLFDLSGKLVRSATESTLNVGSVHSGLYLLKVQTSEGIYVEKVMIE
ncbi:MAG: T9SS type A sorting domain-containing protein [Saprospiraceae bacterium]